MELYRFTGALTSLVISGGISLFFFVCNMSSGSSAHGFLLYMLVPAMVLFGFLFDVQFIWKKLSRISKLFRPSFIGSAAFWTIAWPFCWMLADLFARAGIYFRDGQFIIPEYLTSLGLGGIFGFLLFQAAVGSGMGLIYFMAYRPVFGFVSVLRVKAGMADREYEMSIEEELGEFGFRK
jgi:hypothetical protein